MKVDTRLLIPITDANRNFSRVARLVDEEGLAVILRNNRPSYVVVDFSEYESIRTAQIAAVTDRVIDENLDALSELAK